MILEKLESLSTAESRPQSFQIQFALTESKNNGNPLFSTTCATYTQNRPLILLSTESELVVCRYFVVI